MTMKILIVDDSKAIYLMVSQMLENSDHDTLWAEDGREALNIIESGEEIDLILLDWNMPVMNGLEFIQALRSIDLPKRIPVVMVTTEGSHEKVNEAIKSGVDGHILKPIDAEQLRDVLGEYLSIE